MASIRTAGLTKHIGDLRAVNEIDLDDPLATLGETPGEPRAVCARTLDRPHPQLLNRVA